ncbi:MAG: GNAT family N-acetyltransferase [Myxococcales bacterium]
MLRVRVLGGIGEVGREEWNALLDGGATPFVDWRWLWALEDSGCASAESGWSPRHVTLWRRSRLVAAAPGYLKTDSDGDFSRDFDLASAAMRARRAYYPKLVVGVPFTPVTGRRLLLSPEEERQVLLGALGDALRDVLKAERCGTVQVLFADPGGAAELAGLGFARRVSHQFHWHNEGYREPDDFLARFSSKRRHMIRRERAAPSRQGLEIRTVRGEELARDRRSWSRAAHALHAATVAKLMWGRGWLDQAFYDRIFEAMPEALEIVSATRGGTLVAGAFNVASATRLYGRYWGCFEEHPFLHFNVCYYHSIDECIRRGVQVFEGGAGGEHKLARGFLPTETHSAHLFADPRLDEAFRAHLAAETRERIGALAAWHRESPILRAGGAA